MKLLLLILIIIFFENSNKNKEFSFVISNPKIINVEDGSLLLDHDILINGNIIAGIVPHRKKYDKSVTVIDAKNKYAIPGLWDMHVHALWPDWFDLYSPLMIANGVIGFRDTWGSLEFAETIRMKMETGEIPFQRFILSGNIIDGAKKIWPASQEAATAQRGIELVDSLYKAGTGFIKVYSRLKPDIFSAIANRCKELNIPFAGHVPTKVKLIEASNVGMYSMEHLNGFTEAFSDIEDSIFQLIKSIDYESEDSIFRAGLVSKRTHMILRSKIVKEKVKQVSDVLKNNNTWIVPTMLQLRTAAYRDILDTVKDFRLNFLPISITNDWWKSGIKNRTPQFWINSKIIYEKNFENLGELNKQGLAFLAGTDFPNPYCIPGFGLHDELELMNSAGLSTLKALQSATINPAKYLKKSDSLGSIVSNKYADILLLSDNPLVKITNTRRIEGLVINGKFYNKKELEELKQKAKKVARKLNLENEK